MGILRDVRRGVEALERIATGISAAARSHETNLPSLQRLEELERTRGLWEAEVEGILQKAEGKLKAAANSEARTRTMKKSYEEFLDPFGDDREEVEEAIQESDAEPGYAEELQPVRLGVEAESKKAYATRMKFS